MRTMPGNEHAANSKFLTEGLHAWQGAEGETDATCIAAALDAQTQATLALAYEQRTQTLLAAATATFADGSAMFPAQIDSARRQIAPRLGLDET